MRKLITLAVVFAWFSFTVKENHTQVTFDVTEVSFNDKSFLLDYYQQTLDNLKKSVASLSEAQMHYQLSEGQWSISQCLEHIVLTERMLFNMTKDVLDSPANPGRKEEIKLSDQQLIEGMNDRSFKAQAPEVLLPKGIYDDPGTALRDLQKERGEIVAFINTVSEEALRDHISDSPFGPVDAYQWFIYNAAHTSRHTAQIEEVKSSQGFPK